MSMTLYQGRGCARGRRSSSLEEPLSTPYTCSLQGACGWKGTPGFSPIKVGQTEVLGRAIADLGELWCRSKLVDRSQLLREYKSRFRSCLGQRPHVSIALFSLNTIHATHALEKKLSSPFSNSPSVIFFLDW
jgi:hypothetical protein